MWHFNQSQLPSFTPIPTSWTICISGSYANCCLRWSYISMASYCTHSFSKAYLWSLLKPLRSSQPQLPPPPPQLLPSRVNLLLCWLTISIIIHCPHGPRFLLYPLHLNSLSLKSSKALKAITAPTASCCSQISCCFWSPLDLINIWLIHAGSISSVPYLLNRRDFSACFLQVLTLAVPTNSWTNVICWQVQLDPIESGSNGELTV